MRIVFLWILLWLPCVAYAEDGVGQHALDGAAFTLSSGETIRLANLDAPYESAEAKALLETLIAGQNLRIDPVMAKRDRHNRIIAQVYLKNGKWVQGEMLTKGYGIVTIFKEDKHDTIEQMLKEERIARVAKTGIWNMPAYRVISPQESGQYLNRFKLVEGKVISVNPYHGNIYINFNEHWKGNFSAFISRKNMDAFSGMDLAGLKDKTVTLRGWISDHKGPSMDIIRPEQIEIE